MDEPSPPLNYNLLGQRIAQIAQALGMKVLAYDSNPKEELETETSN